MKYTVHARQRMQERRVQPAAVLACLRKGIVTEGPIINIHGNRQVRMTRTVDRETLHLVVAIEWRSRLIVITTITD